LRDARLPRVRRTTEALAAREGAPRDFSGGAPPGPSRPGKPPRATTEGAGKLVSRASAQVCARRLATPPNCGDVLTLPATKCSSERRARPGQWPRTR
jgi:hypothetical protein